MRSNLKALRESASVLLVAKSNFGVNKLNNCNYKLLTMQRSSNTGFMPGAYVFPGGNISKADGSKDWLKLYDSFGFKLNIFDKIKSDIHNTTAEIQSNEIPKFLSLRICAIRETFEESGILICKSNKIKNQDPDAIWASFFGFKDIKEWQDRVHENPEQFINLCKQYQIYPDVWALKEWSNWLTPPPMTTKYDTMFFIVCFSQMPPVHPEKSEVEKLEWSTPDVYIKRNLNEEIFLPPPQFYEMNRLRNFTDIEVLAKFAKNRSTCGCEKYFPYRIETKEGLYTILPGDDLYPKVYDLSDEEIPFVEKLSESNTQNRLLHTTLMSYRLMVKNLKPKYNQIAPLNATHKL